MAMPMLGKIIHTIKRVINVEVREQQQYFGATTKAPHKTCRNLSHGIQTSAWTCAIGVWCRREGR